MLYKVHCTSQTSWLFYKCGEGRSAAVRAHLNSGPQITSPVLLRSGRLKQINISLSSSTKIMAVTTYSLLLSSLLSCMSQC